MPVRYTNLTFFILRSIFEYATGYFQATLLKLPGTRSYSFIRTSENISDPKKTDLYTNNKNRIVLKIVLKQC